MATTRVLRGLVPVEILVVIGAALLAPGLPIPVVIPLLAAASLSLWSRGRSFADVLNGPTSFALIGACAGALGLVLAVFAGTPVVEAVTGHGVQWSMYPIVRGSPNAFFTIAILVALGAVASELVLRGWVLERVRELAGGAWANALAIGAAALVEAMLASGMEGEARAGLAMRAGAAVFSVALGWMYLAGGRRLVAPICARLVFTVGALVLEALHVVG